MGRKIGVCPIFGMGELGPHLTQCRLVEAYLPTKWHLDPSIHLATTDMGLKLGVGAVPLGSGGTKNQKGDITCQHIDYLAMCC